MVLDGCNLLYSLAVQGGMFKDMMWNSSHYKASTRFYSSLMLVLISGSLKTRMISAFTFYWENMNGVCHDHGKCMDANLVDFLISVTVLVCAQS